MGNSLVRQAPAALGGVTATVVFQRSSQWCEEKNPRMESQDKPLCLPSAVWREAARGLHVTAANENTPAQTRGASFLVHLSGAVTGDLGVNMLAQLSAQRRRLAAGDVVLFGEPAFFPYMSQSSQMFFGSAFVSCLARQQS